MKTMVITPMFLVVTEQYLYRAKDFSTSDAILWVRRWGCLETERGHNQNSCPKPACFTSVLYTATTTVLYDYIVLVSKAQNYCGSVGLIFFVTIKYKEYTVFIFHLYKASLSLNIKKSTEYPAEKKQGYVFSRRSTFLRFGNSPLHLEIFFYTFCCK